MSTTASPNERNPLNVILAIFLAIIAFMIIFSSCKSPEKIMDKAYKTVSTDPAPATEKRKAQLVSWVSANFPTQEKVIEKKTIIKVVDTSQYQFFRTYIVQLNQRLSEKNCPTLNADSIFNLELIGTIGKINAEKQALQFKLEHSETKSKSKDKYLWWFIISVVVFVLSHYLRSKITLPFKLPFSK